MEFCEGGKVDDLPYMKNHKISSDEIYLLYIRLAMKNLIGREHSINLQQLVNLT